MRELPPLNALRAFEAAARRGSFKGAAEELHVTPTAISHQIRHLEDLLGCALFYRRPRPVRLSAAGRRLYPVLRDAFDGIAGAVAGIRSGLEARPLKVTTTPAFASRWLIPRLGALREACAGREIAVEATERVIDLHAGEVDFAIRYARSPDPELECRPLFSDHYLPVCHPERLRDAPIESPGDLAAHPLIHFDWKRDDPHAPTWARWLATAHQHFPDEPLPDPEGGIRFSEEIHAIEAAVSRQGIALISDVLVASELASGALIQPVDLAIDGLTFYAAFLPDAPRRELIEAIVTAIGAQHDS
ncbi:MAG: LysR family transcriptional regulator [Xanthomonadales bacterium]|nr:LysR family transcriptional regulator [Xanthomonadales bacterium]|tara:strand:+ start:1217 stop:2125 length:909 start_codon:yes stop_codon:yes gene_type:complete